MIWQLTFFMTPGAGRTDGFDIGYFDSLDEAEDGTERDLLCSPVFADKDAAEACLAALQERYQRDHLGISRIQVNQRW